MKTKLVCLAGFLAVAAARLGAAEAPAKDSSTVLFENEKVRTILYVTSTYRTSILRPRITATAGRF